MAEKTTNYQCPACTGPLHYDGASGKLVCDYCGSTYDVKDIEARYAKKQAAADTAAEGDAKKAARLPRQDSPVWSEAEAEGLNSYSCPTCGAELVCDETTAATTCPYCGNPTVLGGKLSGKLKPEYILPFRLDKKAAIAQLTRYYKGKAFLPKAFKNQNHIAEIQGVYVPFWLYDAKADARGRYEGQNSESHREGDYMVTTTQHYDVRREGSADFAKVPVDGSSKMPNTHMDAIEPFDYGDLKPFSTAYLPGYLADRYDEDADACAERAYRRMYNSTADALHATTGGYSEIHPISENINVDMTHAHYALLPVWMLHTRWKDKDFLFAMNGQTGRLIGDLPVDKSRVAAWFAGISLPLMAVLAFLLFVIRGWQNETHCKTLCRPAGRSGAGALPEPPRLCRRTAGAGRDGPVRCGYLQPAGSFCRSRQRRPRLQRIFSGGGQHRRCRPAPVRQRLLPCQRSGQRP